MSLIRQLWLAVICITAIAFTGSFIVSMLTARDYLEQQLYAQSSDNAAALALSMSQHGKDTATVELFVSALFDSGHFQLIRYSDVYKRTVVERKNETQPAKVPPWFSRLFPLDIRAGEALVSDGWQQSGHVTVIAAGRYAYEALWQGALKLLGWMLAAGLLSGLLGHLLLRNIQKPLNLVMEQANAITERRFITLPLPRSRELKAVVSAMNTMVARLQNMFSDQAHQIDVLRHEVISDKATGLPQRHYFLTRAQAALQEDDHAAHGCLILFSLNDMQFINKTLGREKCDELLANMGARLRLLQETQHDWLAGRLAGGEFALLAPSLRSSDALTQCQPLLNRMADHLNSQFGLQGNSLQAAIVPYQHGMQAGELLQQGQDALTQARDAGDDTLIVVDSGLPEPDLAPWRQRLENAIAQKAFSLEDFPVQLSQGQELHREMVLRMHDAQTQTLLKAGHFIPQAQRLGLLPALDTLALELALADLRKNHKALAINLAIESLQSPGFLEQLQKALQAEPVLGPLLWLEISEHGLSGDLSALREFSMLMHKFGVHIGIDHFGRHFSSLPHLHELGLDYLKIDSSLIKDIHKNPKQQALVHSISSAASHLELITIAEYVQLPEEQAILEELKVSAITGPLLHNQKAR